MANPGLIKNYIAGGTVSQYRVVKFGANDGEVVQGAAATDLLIGVSCQPGDVAAGERVDIVRSDMADVEYGGVITRGKKLTSDADGKVVEAAPAAGANVHIIGIAEVSGITGDIVPMYIEPSVMQG
ncbi:MAG: DUF2190 family protein [Methylobacter tundripaludum]|nr:DUF2190 family protein [Methylobacter tundripaludum]